MNNSSEVKICNIKIHLILARAKIKKEQIKLLTRDRLQTIKNTAVFID